MNFISRFVLVLLVLTFAAMAVMEGNNSTAAMGSFVTLKRDDGGEFRAFVAGPADAKAAVLIVMIISASPMPLNNPCNTSALLDTARLPSIFMEANQRPAMRRL